MVFNPVNSNRVELSASVKKMLAAQNIQAQTLDELLVYVLGTFATKQEVSTAADSLQVDTGTLASGAPTFGLKSGSVDAAKLTTRYVTTSTEGDTLSVDYSNIKKNLPTGFTLVSATTTVLSNTGTKASLSGTSANIKMPENAAEAVFSANIQTPNGLMQLTKRIPVPQQSANTVLDINDLTVAPGNLSVKEHLTLLSAEVAQLKSK